MHKVLFNTDSSATSSNRLQDVQAVLLCAQRLGSRNPRAGQLLTKELEDFRGSSSADSVNKHQCRFILQTIKYVTSHPDNRLVLNHVWTKFVSISKPCGPSKFPFLYWRSYYDLIKRWCIVSSDMEKKLKLQHYILDTFNYSMIAHWYWVVVLENQVKILEGGEVI